MREAFFVRALAPLVAAVLLFGGCGRPGGKNAAVEARAGVDPPPISAQLHADLEAWLAKHGEPPADYVTGLFAHHDVVILGEQHRIRHDPLFVQELLPRLHGAGVRTLAIEFAGRGDQALIDSLVTGPEWREDVGREIFFRQFMPWGFREYVDVLRAAWRLNRDRPSGTPPFRVLGVNNSIDYSLFQSEADWNDLEVQKRANAGKTEADWAAPVLAAVKRGEKVLGYCGVHHAFTEYRQPRVVNGAFTEFGRMRFGNHLREALGKRAVTVFLHAPWNGPAGYDANFVHPGDGRLDAFMLARTGGPFAVGFTIEGSPLADLPIENAVYKHGHDRFSLAQFCDGWVYTKPVGRYEPVGYIEDWINEGNLARARATAMNPRWRTLSVDQLNAGCRSYLDDFRKFFGHLR